MKGYYIKKTVDSDLEGLEEILDDIYMYEIFLETADGLHEFICECACEDDANYIKSLLEADFEG